LATPDLAGRKVLIVDDDIKHICVDRALEQHGITVLNAENGKDGLETLKTIRTSTWSSWTS